MLFEPGKKTLCIEDFFRKPNSSSSSRLNYDVVVVYGRAGLLNWNAPARRGAEETIA